jgi:hypothetical protein
VNDDTRKTNPRSLENLNRGGAYHTGNPATRKQKIGVMLSPNQLAALEHAARVEGVERGAMARDLIAAGLAAWEKENFKRIPGSGDEFMPLGGTGSG